MSSASAQESIVVNDLSYPVSNLTEFGFIAAIQLPSGETSSGGILVLGEQRLGVQFRVRRQVNGEWLFSFVDMPIASSEIVRKHLVQRERASSGNEALESRTYDELASGVVGSTSDNAAPNVVDPNRNSRVKSLALMMMLFAMVGLVVLSAYFLRSRSALSVGNSALVGNCLPVNAKVEGEIVEVLVTEGDSVRKGDVLLRLENPDITNAHQQLTAQLATARSKVRTLKKQKKTFASKLEFASKKLALDREVAVSQLQAAIKTRMSAQAAYERLKPFAISGSVTQLELAEAENLMLAEESNCIAMENLVRQIDFSQEAAKVNVLIIGDRVDDEMGRIEAELEIAQAEALELENIRELSTKRKQELEVVAPRDGKIYVAYRQPGEYIKVADELVGLSYQGKTWAAGQVSAGQASRVLPGQPVTISVPSLNVTIEGTVMSVGHRAMYSKGNYNADFRGATATDVPIKVFIDDLPNNVPSGIRLDMAINTGFGIEWVDNLMGYELKPIGTPSKVSASSAALAVADRFND